MFIAHTAKLKILPGNIVKLHFARVYLIKLQVYPFTAVILLFDGLCERAEHFS
jgi:hypothetical protein